MDPEASAAEILARGKAGPQPTTTRARRRRMEGGRAQKVAKAKKAASKKGGQREPENDTNPLDWAAVSSTSAHFSSASWNSPARIGAPQPAREQIARQRGLERPRGGGRLRDRRQRQRCSCDS